MILLNSYIYEMVYLMELMKACQLLKHQKYAKTYVTFWIRLETGYKAVDIEVLCYFQELICALYHCDA